MSVEVCSYRLTLRGTPVGTHVIRTEYRGQTTRLEGRLMLQGSLGQLNTTQESLAHRRRHNSLAFREATERRGEKRVYDVAFDLSQGLVKASRGPNDQASVPYLQPYRDPLSLLHELRCVGIPDAPLRIPMLGKDVTVLYLGTTPAEGPDGPVEAYVYRLHPGNAYVYVDSDRPHAIVQMSQELDGHLLDALLVRVSQEESMPAPPAGEAPRKGKKRRRRRRR